MQRNRLPKSAIDSGGKGLDLFQILLHLDVCELEDVKKDIRSGQISLNRNRVRDVNYVLLPGTYLVSKKTKPVAEVTIL